MSPDLNIPSQFNSNDFMNFFTDKIDNIRNTITNVDSTASSTSASFIAPKEKLHCFTTIGQDELNKLQIKSNQITFIVTSPQHKCLVAEIITSVLQTVQKTTIYIWTVHIYRLYRRQCAKYTYIYSVHIVYYKDILSYQLHIIHRMCTSTLCTLSIHYVVYT